MPPRLVLLLASLFLVIASTAAKENDLLWSDEFGSGTVPNPDIWEYDVGAGGWGNGEIQSYEKDNVKVEDGNLVLSVKSETSLWGGRTFTSGRIRSSQKFEFKYGTVQAKIRVPNPANGLWPALWMLGTTFPQTKWPMSGEIDIMELYVPVLCL